MVRFLPMNDALIDVVPPLPSPEGAGRDRPGYSTHGCRCTDCSRERQPAVPSFPAAARRSVHHSHPHRCTPPPAPRSQPRLRSPPRAATLAGNTHRPGTLMPAPASRWVCCAAGKAFAHDTRVGSEPDLPPNRHHQNRGDSLLGWVCSHGTVSRARRPRVTFQAQRRWSPVTNLREHSVSRAPR